MPRPTFSSHRKHIEEIIRVNHAGEYGAKRIYEGQLAAIKGRVAKTVINEMYKSELVHLEYFDNLLKLQKVRPTFLFPLWHIMGYMLGNISAKIGAPGAMLLTENIENTIEEHYHKQIIYLQSNNIEPELRDKIAIFRKEEMEHEKLAIKNFSQKASGAKIASFFIKSLCKLAIKLSKKI